MDVTVAAGWRSRVGPLPAALAGLAVLEAIALGVLWPLVADVNDLVGFLAGARALLAGADPYDAATWATSPYVAGQRPETAVFGYPPWVAVAFIPLALLPFYAASLLWTAGSLALAVLGAMRLAERWGAPIVPSVVLAGASWPAILVFLQGQWAFLLVALAASCALDVARGRDARAGAAWGAMLLAKPQLFVLASLVFGAWAIARGRGRAVLAAGAVVGAGAVAGTLAAPGWIAPYAKHVLLVRGVRSTQQPTLAGLAGDVAGELWPLAWVAMIVALGVLIVLAWRASAPRHRLPIAFAGWLTLSVAAAAYSWSYDHYLAIPLAVATLAVARDLGGRARLGVLAALGVLYGPLAFALWESAYVRWHDTLAGLVPALAIALACVTALWARRAEPLSRS